MSIYPQKQYIPYTYLIGWSKLNRWYYGVEYKNYKSQVANPTNLWTIYFTSSKIVKEYRKEYGEPDVIEIRKVFNTSSNAKIWETKVLQKLNAKNSEKWLNRTNSDGVFGPNSVLSEEHKRKIKNKTSGINNPMYGKHHTDETKSKITKSLTGKKQSKETINKRFQSMKQNSLNGKKRKPISQSARKNMSRAQLALKTKMTQKQK